MKTILIGTLAFLVWGAGSSWYYVCNIKQLCADPEPVQSEVADVPETPPPAVEPEIEETEVEEEPEPLAPPESVTVYHAFDQSDFIRNGTQVSDFADQAVAYFEQNPDQKVRITGHTDSKGTESYNQQLGQRRAEAVSNFLVGLGISSSSIETTSEGESNPVGDNSTEDGRSRNRRTIIQINP